jgi:pimeloyl-ACP methyl ester carboxylesterase
MGCIPGVQAFADGGGSDGLLIVLLNSRGSRMYSLSRGSGYPVLFIHGMPTSSHLWNGIIERLRGQFTCIAVDLPGLGRSPSVPYCMKHLEMLAGQIEEIRIQQGFEKWHIVGHDAGSAVAVHYAHRFSERVDHLVLLSPAVFPELKPFPIFRLLRVPVIGELLAPLVSLVFWRLAMRLAVEKRRSEMRCAIDDFRAPFSGIRGAWRLMSVLRFGDPADVLAAIPGMLPELSVPTLICHGASDRAIPHNFAERAASLIPKSRVVIVDSGHYLPLNRPEVVAHELRQFFGQPALVN